MKTTYDRFAKIYTNYSGHMTKMAIRPIYGNNPLDAFFTRTSKSMALGRVMYHWECEPYKISINAGSMLTLTYFMARSNLIHNAIIWEKS